jgi:hypothetical protein
VIAVVSTAAGAVPERAEARSGRRILLAPVTISPTKPLTPTHLKYLLSLDMLYRATATFADMTFLYHHATYAGSRQVAGFWEYLDRCHPDAAAATMTEEDIGELYTAYNRADPQLHTSLEPTVRRAEAGWIHPVSARLLDIWEQHYRVLGLYDPALGRTGPVPAPEAEILDLLVRRDLCIDLRDLGAPAYLDATSAGLPLRCVRSPEGQANYLLYLLREVVPLLADHDLVVLAHDTELRSDYRTIVHLLAALGAEAVRFESSRVPINGMVQSTRFGGWQGYTLGAVAGPVIEEFGSASFRLGLRLYLVGGLGRTAAPQSFSMSHLRRWIRRARRLLDEHGADCAAGRADRLTAGRYLARRAGRRGYADPYQVATALMSRDPDVPVAPLLRVVMGAAAGDGTLERQGGGRNADGRQ